MTEFTVVSGISNIPVLDHPQNAFIECFPVLISAPPVQ